MSFVDVNVGVVDVFLCDVQFFTLGVDKPLHIFLHFERIHHSALDDVDLLLLYFDHALVMQRLLVYLVHLNLHFSALAVLICL